MSDLVPCFLPRVAARSKPEDSLTEAVAHLLEFAGGLRDRFQACLWPGSDESVESKLWTQRGGEAGGIVDIRWLLDGNPDGRRAIVECKLNARFTDNQPTAYLAELAKRTKGVFVLLAPSVRLRDLCEEAVVRLRSTPAFQKAIWEKPDRETKGYLGRAADIQLVALPWVTLSRWCREAATHCEGRLRYQLEETAAVMDTHDHSFGLPPNPSQQASIAREILDFQYLVRHARAVVSEMSGVEAHSLQAKNGEGLSYGFNITVQRAATTGDPLWFWFGLWFLAEGTESCLFLEVADSSSREWLARNKKGKVLHLGDHWVVPFKLKGDWPDIIEQLDAWLRDLLTPVAAG
ncbi:MAG: hypothetical protein ACHQ9S_21350 [Candidatus Binatia bacterium]